MIRTIGLIILLNALDFASSKLMAQYISPDIFENWQNSLSPSNGQSVVLDLVIRQNFKANSNKEIIEIPCKMMLSASSSLFDSPQFKVIEDSLFNISIIHDSRQIYLKQSVSKRMKHTSISELLHMRSKILDGIISESVYKLPADTTIKVILVKFDDETISKNQISSLEFRFKSDSESPYWYKVSFDSHETLLSAEIDIKSIKTLNYIPNDLNVPCTSYVLQNKQLKSEFAAYKLVDLRKN